MFAKIYAFEIRYWLKQPMVYVFMGINALLVFGAVASDNVTIGQAFDNLHKNAPYVVQSLYAYMSAVTFLLVTAFVQASALRDFGHRTEELIFTTPLRKTPYLLGRFLGACTIALVPFLGVTLGILLGGAAPWLDPDRVGAIAWNAHLWGIAAFVIPNTLIVGGVVFAIAAATRSTAATFVGAIGILVAYSIAGILLGDLESESLGILVDGFGIGTFENLTKYWTVAERNSQALPLGGSLLINRLIWMALAAGLVGYGVRIFRFTVEAGRRKKRAVEPAPLDPDIEPHFQVHEDLPHAGLSFTTSTHFRQMLSQAWVDFRGILRSTPFMIILLIGMVNVGFALWQSNQFYGLATYPVTYRMVDLIRGTGYLFTVILLVLYTGELVWKERLARMDEIHDALPSPTWVPALGKLLAMMGLLVVLQLLVMTMGIIAQASKGYTNFELAVYFKELLVLDLVAFGFLAVMSFLVHAVVNNRFLGYFVFVALMLLNTFIWGPLKLQSVMLRYGGTPSYTFSDMNGFGPYVAGLFWFNLYWLLFAGLLLGAVTLFWVRGLDVNFSVRRLNARLRLSGSTRWAMLGVLVVWFSTAGFVYYNTQVINEYTPTRAAEQRQVRYELDYKATYEGMPQPRVVDVQYEIDVYPAERDLRVQGEFLLVNRSADPIDTLFVNLQDEVEMALEIPGATLARED